MKKVPSFGSAPLQNKITGLVLLLFLCGIWALTFFISKWLEREMTAQLETQQFSIASYIADSIEGQVKLRINSLTTIADKITPELIANPGKLRGFLRDKPLLANLFQTGVVVISGEGIGIADFPVLPGRAGASLSDREYFTEVVATGRPAVGKPRIGPFSHKPVIAFAVPVVTPSGKLIAVLAGFTLTSDPGLLGSIENSAYKDFPDRLDLIYPKYRIHIAASDPTRVLTPTPKTGVNPLFDRFMSGSEGSGVTVNSRGMRLLISAKQIPTPGWFIRVGLPTKIAFEPIHSMKKWAYSLALGLSLLSSFLVLLVIRHALRPLYHATRLIKDMTEERLPPQDIPVTYNDEIGQLISSFNVHLNYRRQTEEEFRFHSEIMKNIAEGIYIVRAEDGSIVYANERFEKMFGYEPGEMIGKDVSIVNTPNDKTAEETKKAIIEALAETGESHGEVNSMRKDGTRFWCYANVSLLEHSKYGKVFVSVHTDITDRKHMEEREQLSEAILEHLNQQTGIENTIRDILQMVKQSTGFDAVGIRLRKGEDFPYFVQDGFSTDFLLTENTLTVCGPNGDPCRDKDGKISLECTCGLIISGHTYPANPLFTPYGSFWTNNSVPLLDLPADQDPRLHPRNRCIHEGFHSVALIPLKAGKDIMGLLQLNDRRKDQFTLETIHFFEGLCNSIGIAISRKEAEDALRKSEENLRNITSSLAEGIYVLNKQGSVIFMNPEAERLLGWSYTELMNRHVHMVFHYKKPDGSPLPQEECNMDKVISTGIPYVSRDEVFIRKDGIALPVSLVSSPIIERGKVVAAVTAFRDITERKKIEAEREKLIIDLGEALSEVKQLSGLLPICASCKKIRDDKGYWNQIETYISEHSEALFTHAICPECGKKLYPEYYDKVWGEEEK